MSVEERLDGISCEIRESTEKTKEVIKTATELLTELKTSKELNHEFVKLIPKIVAFCVIPLSIVMITFFILYFTASYDYGTITQTQNESGQQQEIK